jgi:hypothetical protein
MAVGVEVPERSSLEPASPSAISTLPSSPWQQYREFFVKFLRDANDQQDPLGLQLATTPYPALWDNPTYGPWLVRQQVANNIPSWGSFYFPSVGSRVTDAYMQFMFNVEPQGSDDTVASGQARASRAALSSHLSQREELRQRSAQAWQKQASAVERFSPAAFARWSQSSPHRAALDGLETSITTLSGQLLQQSRRAGTDSLVLAQAIARFTNPEYQEELVDDNGYRSSYPSWAVNPDLSAFIAAAEAGKAPQLDFAWSATGAPGAAANSPGAPAGLAAAGFLRPGSATSAGSAAASAPGRGSPSGYTMRVRAQGFIGITMQPGRWFFGRLFARFQDGPFIPSGPFGSGGAKFWGAGGTFPYRPTRAYVAYKPSISVVVGGDELEATKRAWSRGETIGVGPFEFSSGDQATFEDSSFELRGNSPQAMLMAVSNVIMPGGALVLA